MFFKEISDLGIMVVICGVFLYFSKTIFDYMIKEITLYVVNIVLLNLFFLGEN